MIHLYEIRRHDTAPSLHFVATELGGFPIDLTGYTAKFLLRQRGALLGVLKVSKPAVVEDASRGLLRYDWEAEDTDTVGVFFGEFEVSKAGQKRTFPADTQIRVDVVGDLDDA